MTITVTEVVALAFSRLLVSVSDAVSVTESINVTRRTGNDINISVSDDVVIGGISPIHVNVFDAASVTEFADTRFSRLLANVADSVSVTESRAVSIGGASTFNPALLIDLNQLI